LVLKASGPPSWRISFLRSSSRASVVVAVPEDSGVDDKDDDGDEGVLD
jgi:hypothetical protein